MEVCVRKLWISSMAVLLISTVAMTDGVAHDEEKDETGTSVLAGVSVTDGNSDTLNVNVGIEHVCGTSDDVDQVAASAEWNYGETEDETTTENALGEVVWTHTLSGDTYAYLAGSLFHDDLADLDYRLILGPGLGHTVWKNDAANLSLEIGAVWIREESKVASSSPATGSLFASTVGGAAALVASKTDFEDDAAALRIAQAYHRTLSDNANMWQTAEYLPHFDDFDIYLLTVEVGVEASISSKSGLRLVVRDRIDSQAKDRGFEENDLQVLAGLSYKL